MKINKTVKLLYMIDVFVGIIVYLHMYIFKTLLILVELLKELRLKL